MKPTPSQESRARAIYPDDLAARFKDRAGDKYRPSNGTEGDIFYASFCAHCQADAFHRQDPDTHDGCPILADTFALNIDDPRYPSAWQYDKDGQPTCTEFSVESDNPPRCDKTPDMFK